MACRILPRAVIVLFAAQNHVVTAGGTHAQVIESGKELNCIQVVAGACGKDIPSAFVVALLVVRNAFAGVIKVVVDFLIRVIRAHLDAGVEQESFGKVPVQEQANRSRIVVMRGRIRQVRNRKGIHQLRANVDLMMTGRIREYNMGSLGE